MQDSERRQALADFLKTRRSRLTPEAVGLPRGTRRRTPGLRREEVAQLAHMGTTWYTWLEQEREIRVSVDVLNSLASALMLTPDERRHLFTLAEQALPASEPPFEEKISPMLERFIDSLGDIPCYVLGRRWDRIAWNAAACALFEDFSQLSVRERNLIWQVMTSTDRNRFVGDSEYMTRLILAEFRSDYGRHVGDPWFVELIRDLEAVSSEFRQWWTQYDVLEPVDRRKVMNHPVVGTLVFEHVTLLVPENSDLKLMIYNPLPECDTPNKLRQLMQASR